jgi:superfamily II DNA/RNA helicase
LYQSIVKALGAPQLSVGARIGDVKRQAFELIKTQEVEILVLDEMDYILSTKYVKHNQAMDAIKHVGNNANISLVCMGTTDTEELQSLNFQYFRRFPITRLERFIGCNDEFITFLSNIEKQLEPPEPIGLGNKETILPLLLHEMSMGIVGIITPTIQEAYRLLGVSGEINYDYSKAVLTIPILRQAYQNIVSDSNMDKFKNKLKR